MMGMVVHVKPFEKPACIGRVPDTDGRAPVRVNASGLIERFIL
jgi:hypothetical protein